MKWFGVVNLLLGTMAVFSVALGLLFAVLESTTDLARYYYLHAATSLRARAHARRGTSTLRVPRDRLTTGGRLWIHNETATGSPAAASPGTQRVTHCAGHSLTPS